MKWGQNMNSTIINSDFMGPTIVAGLAAIMATGSVSGWATPIESVYTLNQNAPTFSNVDSHIVSRNLTGVSSFQVAIEAAYLNLLVGQEPLGSEIERLWDKNIVSLYEE